MRIGVNTYQLHTKITGAGRFAKNILRALSKIDRENEYILFLRKDNAGYYNINKENFTADICNVTRGTRFRRHFAFHFQLPHLARKYNLDLFWSPSDIIPFRPLPCLSSVTIHDLKRFVMPQEFPVADRRYYQFFMRNTSRNATLFFTVSESSGRDIMKYLDIPAERIVVVHNGLDPVLAEDEGIPLDSLRRIHGIRRKYILFVGQMLGIKNVPRMIRAFNRCKEAAEYDFVLLGQAGSGSHEIENTIRRESRFNDLGDRIHHIRWATTEQLASFYMNASALFYASLYEGFGFPLIEAMSFGVPIVASDCSSIPEVAGDAALLVDPTDEEAMAKALGRILTEEETRKTLAQRGHERVTQFSWENAAKKYLTVFHRLKQNQ